MNTSPGTPLQPTNDPQHVDLGSGLVDHVQKMTEAAIAMEDMKVWS